MEVRRVSDGCPRAPVDRWWGAVLSTVLSAVRPAVRFAVS